MSCIISNSQTNLSVKNKAFPYQAQAINAIKDLEYVVLCQV